MKINIFLILTFCMCSVCFAQEQTTESDSVQLCYYNRLDATGGVDYSITVYVEDSVTFCNRKCYSMYPDWRSYAKTKLTTEKIIQQAVLLHYQKSDNYLMLEERVEIDEEQWDKLLTIIDKIKALAPKEKNDPDEIIVSTGMTYYLIKDKNGIAFIQVWKDRYRKYYKEIEKILGLKSYLPSPCVEGKE